MILARSGGGRRREGPWRRWGANLKDKDELGGRRFAGAPTGYWDRSSRSREAHRALVAREIFPSDAPAEINRWPHLVVTILRTHISSAQREGVASRAPITRIDST